MPYLKYMMIFFVLNFGVYGSTSSFMMWLPDIVDRFYVGLQYEKDVSHTYFCDLLGIRSKHQKDAARKSENGTLSCDDNFQSETFPMMIGIICILGISNVLLAICQKWVTKKTVLIAVLISGSVSTQFLLWIANSWVALAFLIVFLCCGILRGVLLSYGVQIFPTNYRAMAVSWLLIFGRLGIITATNLVGLLIEKNCYANFMGFGALLLISMLASLLLPATKPVANP